MIYVKPAQGRQVRIPQTTGHLEADGRHVEASPYWHLRIQLGAVVLASPPYMPAAFAAVDACAALLEQAQAEALANGSTPEAAAAALEAFGQAAEVHTSSAAELAERMTPDEAAQVDAYAAAKLGPLRAKLEALASPSETVATASKAKGKAAKAKV